MAKLTFLELTNRVLKRISRNEISDVSVATGTDLIVTEMINEAQTLLSSETDWYSLYRTRKFSTVLYTASTITFNDADPDTMTDSANGFGDFSDAQDVLVSGSTSNEGVWTVDTAVAGTLTLQTADALTAEAAGDPITVTAITYPVASNHSRTIDIMDITNENILEEDISRHFDADDPNEDFTNQPSHFSLQNNAYKLYPMPAAIYSLRERFFIFPATLTANADTSDLPEETQNALLLYAQYQVLNYLQKYEESDRFRIEFERQLKRAKTANKRKIDRLLIFGRGRRSESFRFPRLPNSYDWRSR